MKAHQVEAIKEQIDLHKKRLDDPELTDLARQGILKLIDDHEKQIAKPIEKELSKAEAIQEQVDIHTKRLADPDLSDLQRDGIKKLISDLKTQL